MKIAPSTARVYIYNVNPVSWGGNFYKHIALTGQLQKNLPQRRLEQSLIYSLKKVQELMNASQEYFAGKEGVVLTVNRNIAPSALFAYHRKGVRLRLSTFSNGGVFFHY